MTGRRSLTRSLARRLALCLVLCLGAPAARAEAPRPFVAGSWAEIRAAHAGWPLLAHLWSLTCAPCLVELPRWAELARAHPDAAVVLIATDPPEDAARVAAALERAGLGGIESWQFADAFTERLRFELDPRWRGELPRTLLLDPGGAATAVRGSDMPAVEAWLAGVVSSSPR